MAERESDDDMEDRIEHDVREAAGGWFVLDVLSPYTSRYLGETGGADDDVRDARQPNSRT